jgi:hypothetical protein
MPRHTWTVRVELCESFDAVYAHAYLDHVPIHVSGRGQAPVSRHADVVSGRAVATRRALADLSEAMRSLEEQPVIGRRCSAAHVREEPPGHSAAARAAATSSVAPSVAN